MFIANCFLILAFSNFNGVTLIDLTKIDDHKRSVLTGLKMNDERMMSTTDDCHLAVYCDDDFEFSLTSNLQESENILYVQEGLLLDGDELQTADLDLF